MNFSLWMFYEALKDFNPKIVMREPEMDNIENIRLHSPEVSRMKTTLYIEKSKVFFQDDSDNIVCFHGDNFIILDTIYLNEVFNTIFEFWEETQNWYNHITAMISNNCMLQNILNEFSNHIPFPLMVLDSSQVALAISEKYGVGSMDDFWDNMLATGSFGVDIIANYNDKYKEMISTKEFYTIPNDPFPFPSYNHNIYINNEFMGFLCMIIKDIELTPVHKAWFKIAYQFVASWMDIYAGQNDLLVKNAFFQEILDGNFKNVHRFEAALNTQGWSEKASKKIVVLSCVSTILNMHSHIIKIINQKSSYMYATEYHNRIVILINHDMISDLDVISLIRPILLSTGYYGGMSNSFSILYDISHFLRQAELPIKSGPPAVGIIENCQNYIIPYIMELLQEHSKMNISHPALAILKDYDKKHNNNYYELLYEFLINDCNQTRAAIALNMHRSSLIRKMRNLCEITELDLDDPATKLHLLISFEYEK